MSKLPPRSRGAAPSPRQSSYPTDRPYTSGPDRKSGARPSTEDLQARILAVLALLGPLEFGMLRRCSWIVGPSSTELQSAVAALLRDRRAEASERSELVTIDGIRQRRDFLLLSVAKGGA